MAEPAPVPVAVPPASHRWQNQTPLQSRAAEFYSRSPSSSCPAPQKQNITECPNEDCDASDLQASDGQLMCFSCGTVVDDTNFVNDVDFAETSAGAAVVQGSYIGSDKRFASTMGGRSRRAGGGLSSNEIAFNRGRDELRRIGHVLKLGDSVIDSGTSLYSMAVKLNLIQGRRVRTVAACCLYMATRQRSHDGTNRYILLIDFADAIKINVYRLGQAYRDLKKAMYIDDTPRSARNKDDPHTRPDRPLVPVIEIEDLILRYAKKLEFGPGEQKVANDAARIMRRMKRDWIVTGRIPSGIIGACLILAARMNNYRRTVREVVYIVKAANPTISKRIEEFTRTTAGSLSIDDFRNYSDRMKDNALPPSVVASRERDIKRRALLEHEGRNEADNEAESIVDDTEDTPVRRDADGFAIPPAPTNRTSTTEQPTEDDDSSQRPSKRQKTTQTTEATPAADTNTSTETTKRGRKRTLDDTAARESSEVPSETNSEVTSDANPSKRQKRRDENKAYRQKMARLQHIVQAEDLEEEAELEHEIEQLLHDPEVFANMSEDRLHDYKESARRLAAIRREAEREGRTLKRPYSVAERELDRRILGTAIETATAASNAAERVFDIDAVEIADGEFDDDVEVRNCILSEADSLAKEKIWISANEDWMRGQQRKTLKALVAESTAGTSDPAPTTGKRKRGRTGDGSLLAGSPAPKDAVEATSRMLDKRAPKNWSRFINVQRYRDAFRSATPASDAGSETSASARSTPAPAEPARERRSQSIVSVTDSVAGTAPRQHGRKRISLGLGRKGRKGSVEVAPEIRAAIGAEAAHDWEGEGSSEDEEDEEDDEDEQPELEGEEDVVYDDDDEVGFSDGEFE